MIVDVDVSNISFLILETKSFQSEHNEYKSFPHTKGHPEFVNEISFRNFQLLQYLLLSIIYQVNEKFRESDQNDSYSSEF